MGHANTNCPNPEYQTISAAVAAAHPGVVIAICPALYDEQVVINKPLSVEGLDVNGIDRVLVQPAGFGSSGGPNSGAVISVINTQNVRIENLTIDASRNMVSGCDIPLAGVHVLNSLADLVHNAITGAMLADPSSCGAFFGNGSGVLVDEDGSRKGPFRVSVQENSIHDHLRDGVFSNGPDVQIDVDGNTITGIGPSSGSLQFGVFLLQATGTVRNNLLTEGNCGSFAPDPCIALRSEGVVVRASEGVSVDNNVISKAQTAIFLNGGTKYKISRNVISNIDGFEAIHIQNGLTDTIIEGNRISNLTPIQNFICGIGEVPQNGVAGNKILNNTINDAYCGVSYVPEDMVVGTRTYNTLYVTLQSGPGNPPPPTEP